MVKSVIVILMSIFYFSICFGEQQVPLGFEEKKAGSGVIYYTEKDFECGILYFSVNGEQQQFWIKDMASNDKLFINEKQRYEYEVKNLKAGDKVEYFFRIVKNGLSKDTGVQTFVVQNKELKKQNSKEKQQKKGKTSKKNITIAMSLGNAE